MNISIEKTDDLNGTLSILLEKADYEEKVNDRIKKFRREAKIPGFRPGTAPTGMIQKLYGKSFVAEEVNRLATESMYKYLQENNLDILGQPMLSTQKESDVDFDNKESFTFHFDLGFVPQFEFNISDKDSVTKYNIEVDDKEVENEINNLCRRNGILEKADVSNELSDSILVVLTELDADGNPLEGGITEKETTVIPELIKDEATQKLFLDKKVGDKVKVNFSLLFNGNETVMATTTGLPKEGLADLNPEFEAEVKNIQKFIPAEVNQDLFDKVFGPGVVTDEETFKSKIRENTEMYYNSESEHQLEHTIDHMLMDKHQFDIPETFLKRWLLESHPENYTAENLDDKFEKESVGLRYQLVQEKAIKQFNIEVSAEALDQTALGYSASLLRNYGISNPEFEWVREFTEKQKSDKNFMDKVREIAIQRAVVDKVKEIVTIVEQKTSIEGFYDMIKKHQHEHHH